MTFPFLSLLVIAPVLTGAVLLCFKGDRDRARTVAMLVTGGTTLALLGAAMGMAGGNGFFFEERHAWLPVIGLEYHLGADGISLVFLLLAMLVFGMSLVASRELDSADGRYYGLLMFLQAGLIGTFTAQNFLHFFFYWELSLIPAFFLVKDYGGAQRAFAATQFFIYTMAGSVAMLVGFLGLFLATGTFHFEAVAELQSGLPALLEAKFAWTTIPGERLGQILFLLMLAGVAVKVPLWPLHGWQPLVYAEATTPVTMVLTGVMSKMGVYALIRLIMPIFPREIQYFQTPLLALAVVTILYGAIAAFSQRDIKRLFAYSSLSHLGYCFLGVFAAGQASSLPGVADERAATVNGVILQVLSHGIIAAALFAFAGFLESRNQGQRDIERFGGWRTVYPQFAGLMGVALFASLGLPGLSGFPAEFLIFKGAFSLAPIAASAGVAGLLLTAVYILRFYGQVFHGPAAMGQSTGTDLTAWEKMTVVPAILAALLLGVAPQLAIQFFNGSVIRLVQQMGT